MRKGDKRLLMLNGGYNETPLIEAAHRLGFYVITSGNDPSGAGHQYADEYAPADYSDCNAVVELARRLEVDAICSASNDLAAISASFAAEQLRLSGHDTFETSKVFHEKDEFRRVADSLGLNVPLSRVFDSPDEAREYAKAINRPLMIKPIDMSGGKGISRVETGADSDWAIEKAFKISKAKRVVLEDYIEGTQHGFICYIRGGKVVFDISTDDYSDEVNPWLVCASSGHHAAGYLQVRDSIIRDVESLAGACGAADGFLTIQYMMRDGEPWYIETMRRCLGNLHFLSLSKETGVDWPEWFVASEAGLPCDNYIDNASIGDTVAGFFIPFAHRNGIIKDIQVNPEFQKSVFHEEWFFKTGDFISDYEQEKIGVLSFSCPAAKRDALFSSISGLVNVEQ